MPPPSRAGRPPEDREATQTRTRSVTPEERGHLVLRVAWLREHSRRLYEVDQGGQLSAQLADLADALEVLDRDGVLWR